MFHHILVPLDGSARAEQAFPAAVRIARATGATLILFRVVTLPRGFSSDSTKPPEPLHLSLEFDLAEAKDDLIRLLETDDLEGIGIKTEVRTGQPAQQILVSAEEQQADLIVMCSHGTTGLTRWRLGSVAQKVARHSPVPVLIVREDHPLPTSSAQGDASIVRLLVPLDESPLAEAALLPAAQVSAALSAPGHGSLHLLRVVELVTTRERGGYLAALNEEDVARAKMYLKNMEQQVREGDFAPYHLTVTSSVVLNADIAATLLSRPEDDEHIEGQMGYTMIAMATHGRSGIAHWLLGSITERVLSATTFPMLIVRPKSENLQE